MSTPFPASPLQVAALSLQEFTSALEVSDAPDLDNVCGRFENDANRAVVWLVRYRALRTFSEDLTMRSWLRSGAHEPHHFFEVAACHALNERWEFDPLAFCSAVETLAARRR